MPSALIAAILAAGSLALHGEPERDPRPVPQPVAQPDPLSLDGRDFAGIRLKLEPVEGEILLASVLAHGWTVGSTRRLYLDGDVILGLPGYTLHARRAVVWLERIDDAPSAGGGIYQLFAFLDGVGNPGADPALAVEAERLGVEAVVRLTAPIALRADKRSEAETDGRLVREGELALAEHLRRIIGGRPSPPPLPGPSSIGEVSPIPFDANLPPATRDAPIFAREGVITASAGQVKVVTEEGRTAIMLSGGVILAYEDRAASRTLLIEGEQAVVFLRGERLADPTRYTAEDVDGLYIEGAVSATDGKYTIRADEVYYDVGANRALILRGIFWTYDERSRLPIYVRADALRQESEQQFVAEHARVSTTAFFTPQLSIGASTVTITRGREEDESSIFIDARDIVLRAGNVPFFYWPIFQGDPSRIPIRAVAFQETSATGAALKTSWRLRTMLGDALPPGVQGDLLLDWYFERGPGLGTDLAFGWPDSRGELLLYTLPNDVGRDRVQNGARIERDGEFRGIARGSHTFLIDQAWVLRIEAAHISDETFVPVFFPSLGRTEPELTNRAIAARRDESSLLTVEVAGSFNDFIASEAQLQSAGFGVDRLPEARYIRIADDLLADAPGALLYDGEARVGALALHLDEPLARDRGFARPGGSQRAFGIAPAQSIADRLLAAGYSESTILRFDTRHELSAHLDAGGLIINPFVTGRLTAYDDDFGAFSPRAADETVRLWGAAGARASTTFVRIDDSIASRLFDLHRVRHIVVPSVTAMHAGTTIDHADLPAYDPDVEAIAEGSTVKLALDQTFQTQRGGPGRLRSVDVLRLDSEIVLSSADTDADSPIGRFFDGRPELSNLGDFLELDGAWQATEVVAITGNFVYDLDGSSPAKETIGYIIDHQPDFATYGELRYLAALDAIDVGLGANYRFTAKYSSNGWIVLDGETGEVRSVNAEVLRRYPSLLLRLGIFYDLESDNSGFNFGLQPTGVPGGETRLRGIGSQEGASTSRIGG